MAHRKHHAALFGARVIFDSVPIIELSNIFWPVAEDMPGQSVLRTGVACSCPISARKLSRWPVASVRARSSVVMQAGEWTSLRRASNF